MMIHARTLQVSAPTDRELQMVRTFDARRELVFDAWTKPELLKRWLGVRGGWTFAVCEVDLRVGGAYRYVWRKPGQPDLAMGGVYNEIEIPERVVFTEAFDDPWYPGESVNTMTLEEEDGKTTVTITTRYDSKKTRDAVAASGMETGVAESYDKLDEILRNL